MRSITITRTLGALLLLGTACKGSTKVEIPLSKGQTYLLQPSGKLKVYGSDADRGADGARAQPLEMLHVKRKNAGTGSSTPGCWQCSDCICNGVQCSCTECTSC
jgi:hypothetical protein